MATTTETTAQTVRNFKHASPLTRLLSLPLAALGMICVGLGIGAENIWFAAALVLFTASMMFCWTSILHEAIHHTLWRSQKLNLWMGRLLGTLMFTPYTAYRETHIRHHAYLNTPRDWELWPYSDPQASLAFRRVFVWLDLLLGVVTGPIIYGRIYFSRKSPITSPEIHSAIRNEYLAIVVVWTSIWTFTTLMNDWPAHLRAILLPMYLAGMMQTGRKFTEHLGMASYDPLQGTRTVLPQKWLLRLSSFLNFDIFIHGPHHRHPRVTHNLLKPKMEEYQTCNPESRYPVFHNYWQAVVATLPSMFKNPGCGENVGTADSDTGKEVDSFVSDVVTDVRFDAQS